MTDRKLWRKQPKRPVRNAGDFQGHIDGFTQSLLQGWVKDSARAEPVVVNIHVEGVPVFDQVVCDLQRADLLEAGVGEGAHGFAVALDPADYGRTALIEVFVAGETAPCLTRRIDIPEGAQKYVPLPPPPVDTFKASIESDSPHILNGWMVRSTEPADIFDADVYINGTWFATVRNTVPREDLLADNLSCGLGGIHLRLPAGLLRDGENRVVLCFPDGSLHEGEIRAPHTTHRPPAAQPLSDAPVTVIVPVFNAAGDVATCLDLLVRNTTGNTQLLVIDDASTDTGIAPLLERYSTQRNVRILRNPENLGYTRTVNRGLAEAGDGDIVLLNSDARVGAGWLTGLRRAAASDETVGTVTALSDRAGAFSAPDAGNANPLPFGVDEPEFATAVRRGATGLYPTVPTGNGFCLYIRRACLDAVGLFDDAAFPRGYGEENDFCMRARGLGWRNIIDDATYVFHERSASFGEAKHELMAAGAKVIEARYPDYKTAIRVFEDGPALSLARYRVRHASDALRAGAVVLPRILFVTSTEYGGTPQTNADLMSALKDDFDCWLLRCDAQTVTVSRIEKNGERVRVAEHTLCEPVDPLTHTSLEYDRVVAAWLSEHLFDIVHIRQLIWHSLSLPRLAKLSGAAVIVSFHDFYTVSPSINLLDTENRFCGITPPEGGCYAPSSVWPVDSFPALDRQWIGVWQGKMREALAPCDAFVTTSDSARDRLLSVMEPQDATRFFVIPHGRTFAEMGPSDAAPTQQGKLRILVAGNITAVKGRHIIMALLDLDAAARRLEFHILGDHDFAGPQEGLVLHGAYQRDAFAAHVKRIAPDVGAVFSVWDETYCHTLTEMWAAGLPVMALDYPTVASRVQASGAGWVFDGADVSALYHAILRELDDPQDVARKREAVAQWQEGEGRANTTRLMASKYQALYKSTLNNVRSAARSFGTAQPELPYAQALAFRVAVVSPANAAQTHAPASTYIRMWARTFNTPDRTPTFIRMSAAELLASVETGVITHAIVQRTAIPADLWDKLRPHIGTGALRYMCDLDDDLMNVPADKDPDGTYAAYAPVLRDIIVNAAHVTVSTPPLAARVAPLNNDVSILPNALSGRFWRHKSADRKDDGHVRALYMGNRSHDADFAIVFEALEAVAAQYPTFRLRVIGALNKPLDVVPEWLEIVEVPPQTTEYPAFVSWLCAQTEDIDFGIAPLADVAFNEAKSPLKVIDYAGLGVPVVASAHPVYTAFEDTPHIHLADNTTAAWQTALVRMIQTPERDQTSLRRWVTEHHSLDATLRAFDALVCKVLWSHTPASVDRPLAAPSRTESAGSE